MGLLLYCHKSQPSIISIHPPRVGWDPTVPPSPGRSRDFNPPTPCGVGLFISFCIWIPLQFQSTHPVWGGTRYLRQICRRCGYFNPPTPCGVGLAFYNGDVPKVAISIHPPRVGWDRAAGPEAIKEALFQSTHPVWGGTPEVMGPKKRRLFQSTHPVWGGTSPGIGRCKSKQNFNPPTPCGVGRMHTAILLFHVHFNPPTPCGVGHYPNDKDSGPCHISIHPPRVGWDYTLTTINIRVGVISIHPPRVGWDKPSLPRSE